MFLQLSDVYLWCNLPTFPHAALSRTWQGKGGKRWMERGSQSTRLQCQWIAPLPRGKRFRRGRADGWREPRMRLVPGKVEGEPTARISSPASTLSCRRTLAKSHILSLLPFIVHNMAGVSSIAPTPWKLPRYAQLSISAIPLPLGRPAMGPGDELSGSGCGKSWTQILVPVFIRRATTCKLLEFFVPLFFSSVTW